MSHQPTRAKYAILQQVCQLIPAYLVAKLAREHPVDKQARTFSPWSHVVALLYAQLAHALSLNDVCDALRNHAAKLLFIRGATVPARDTLSHANRTREANMAEQRFWAALKPFHQQCPRFGGRTYRGMPRRFKRALDVVDSSTIKLVANGIDWARHRRKKAAAKLARGWTCHRFCRASPSLMPPAPATPRKPAKSAPASARAKSSCSTRPTWFSTTRGN